MNVEWLESFRVTAGERSFLQASEKLHISQPALTKQIQRLEDYYGVELFVRSSTGIELTEDGRVFLKRIEEILNALRALRSDMKKHFGTRVIRYGAIPSVAAFELPNKIFHLSQQGLNTVITLTASSYELRQALRNRQIDVAVMENSGEYDPSWAVVVTYSQPFYCVFQKGHRLAAKKHLFLADIKGERLVLHPEGCEVREAISRAFRNQGMDLVVEHEAPFGASIVGFVTAGAGVSIVPKHVADRIDAQQLQALQVEDLPSRELAVVARSRALRKVLAEEPNRDLQKPPVMLAAPHSIF